MKHQQQSHLPVTEPHISNDEQIDEEVVTLSSGSKIGQGAQKLDLYKLIKKKKKYCGMFDTPCELYLFITIGVLILLAIYLIVDNRVQEQEINQILKAYEGAESEQKSKSNNQERNEGNNQRSDLTKSQSSSPPDPNSIFIPKKIWYYNKYTLLQTKNWTQQAFQRTKKVAEASGYKISLVNEANWRTYLPPFKQQRIQSAIEQMDDKYSKNKLIPSKILDQIERHITVLEILIEKGGIFIDEDVVLTENLEWLDQLQTNEFLNARQLLKGNAQVFGFHSVEYSTALQKEVLIKAEEDVEKYIVQYPSLNFYFLAAAQSTKFLENLLAEYYKLVSNYEGIRELLKKSRIEIEFPSNGRYTEDHLFFIACQLTLRNQQLQLQGETLAIQSFHIASINQNYGPTKLKSYLGETQIDKIFNHLSLLTLEELQFEFGSIRYLSVLPQKDQIYNQYDKLVESKTAIKHSFIHEYLMGGRAVQGLIETKIRELPAYKWTALPKKLWVYLKEAPYRGNFFMQIWIEHLKKIAKQSNFEFIIVTEQNLHLYLSQPTVESINFVLGSNKLNIYENTRGQLISLSILQEEGGVWVEPFTVFTDNLNWLLEISKEKYVWNRFGDLPKAVVAFHPHFGSPFHWVYEESSGEKLTWHLAYEHAMIAAEPRTELIRDWLNELKANIQLTFVEVVNKFQTCKINNHKWISENNNELLSQDTIKCVLGLKTLYLTEKGVKTSAPEYYGLWGLNGFAGLLKMRQYTDFVERRSMDNPFIWRYSFDHMQKALGNISHLSKIYLPTASKIEQIYLANIDKLTNQIHSQSFLMKMVKSSEEKIIRVGNKLYLESYRQAYLKAEKENAKKQEVEQSLQNIPNLLWVYQGGEIDSSQFIIKYILKNINHYAKLSSFEVRIVNDKNYKQWLQSSSSQFQRLNSFLNLLDSKMAHEGGNLKDHYHQIKGDIILLTLLYEFGGVFISNRLILHEDLSWLKHIQQMSFINSRGKSNPKIFGFYSPDYSSQRKIIDNKSVVQSPSLQNFFLASGKKTPFLSDFIKEFIEIATQNKKVRERVKSLNSQSNGLRGDDPYYEIFFLASQFTFKKKNDELKEKNLQQNALEYYGVYALDTHFYPYRLHRYFSSFKAKSGNIINSLGHTYLEELEQQVGKLRYLSIIPDYYEVKKYIEKSVEGSKNFFISQQSFLQKYAMINETKEIVKYEMPSSKPVEGKIWENLPKSAWIYLPGGLKSSSLSIQLLFIALSQKLSKAGYQLLEVNDTNLDKYIDKFSIIKISKLTSNKNQHYKQLLYRLAILSKHGGISLSSELLALQDFSWVKGIAGFDRRMLFNRFGDLPKLLMFVDTLRSPSNKWTYRPDLQSKVGHMMGWTDTFIASEKENELIKQWFEQLTTYLELDQKELSQLLEECQIQDMIWSKSDSSKLGADALVCVLNKKQISLSKQAPPKNVCDIYKLWGITESLGVNKFEQGLNLDYQAAELNPFLWSQSQEKVQSLIGPVKLMIRLTTRQLSQLQDLIRRNKLLDWGKKDSILVKHLLSITKSRLMEQNGQIVVKY